MTNETAEVTPAYHLIEEFFTKLENHLNEQGQGDQAPIVISVLTERLVQSLGSTMKSREMLNPDNPSAEHIFIQQILPRYLPAFRRGAEAAENDPSIYNVRTH